MGTEPIFLTSLLCSLLSFTIFTNGQGFNTKLPCQLKWIPMATGSSIGEETIAAHAGKIYIARATLINSYNTSLLGHYAKENLTTLFYYYSDDETEPTILDTKVSSFDLLTNPNGCKVHWSRNTTEYNLFGVRLNPNASESPLIARVPVTTSFWYPGPLYNGSDSVPVIIEGSLTYLKGFEILTSFSEGMFLDVREFVYEVDEDDGGNDDSIGVDQIINNSEAILTQNITHSRLIVEKMELVTSNVTKISKYAEAVKKTSGWPAVWGSSTSVTIDQKATLGVEESRTLIKETKLEVHKVVQVPPYSSVTVCSVLQIKDNVEYPYEARGTYRAPGLSTQVLYEYLLEEGIDVFISMENTVDTNVHGVFKGSLAYSTKFIVLDGVHNNCESQKA